MARTAVLFAMFGGALSTDADETVRAAGVALIVLAAVLCVVADRRTS